MSSYSQPYGLTAIHPRPIEVGVFLPGEDKNVPGGQAQGGQPVKHAWKDEIASEAIKFYDLCDYGHLLQIRNKKKTDLLTRFVRATATTPKPGSTLCAIEKIKKDLPNCPEIQVSDKGEPEQFLFDTNRALMKFSQYEAYNRNRADCIAITDDLKENLKSDRSHYSDLKINEIRETLIQLLDTDAKKYARAIFLNPSIHRLTKSGGNYGLGIEHPVSRLKQKLGTDTFITLADNKILSNKEMLAAVKTENLLAKPSNERESPEGRKEERNHLYDLWQLHKKTIENFEAVCNIDIDQFKESEERDRFTTSGDDALFSDSLYAITTSQRGPRGAVGWIRGEKKAIENGWGLDELGLLGMIGRLEAELTGGDPLPQTDERKKYKKQFLEDIAELKAKIWDKPVTNITEKKEVADEIRKFINDQNQKNPVAKEMLSDFPMEKVNLAINKIKDLKNEAQAEQENLSVDVRLRQLYKSSPGFVPFLSELTKVSSQERDSFLNVMNETEDGKKYLKNCAKTLMETLNDQRKRINERIDQLSQSYLENQNTFPENCRDYINYEPLRKQVALNEIKKTETYKQFMVYNKLEKELEESQGLPEKLRKDLENEMMKELTSSTTDRAYHFYEKQTYTNALNNDNTINVKTLSTEIATQRTLFAKYKEKLDTLVVQSKAQFNALKATLTNPNNLANRSGDFVRMYRCVEKLSKVKHNTHKLTQIEKTVNDLVTASWEYIKKNQSDFKFTPAGRKRLNAAENILETARTAQREMIRGRYIDPETQKLKSNSLRNLHFNRNKTLSENAKALQIAQPQAQGGQQNALNRTNSVVMHRRPNRMGMG